MAIINENLKRMIKYLLLQFVNIADGDLTTKLVGAFKLGVILTPFIFVWEKLSKWGITNQDYVLVVVSAILIDWFFGVWKHLKKKTFSFKK